MNLRIHCHHLQSYRLLHERGCSKLDDFFKHKLLHEFETYFEQRSLTTQI